MLEETNHRVGMHSPQPFRVKRGEWEVLQPGTVTAKKKSKERCRRGTGDVPLKDPGRGDNAKGDN